MLAFLVRRLALGVLVLVVLSTASFLFFASQTQPAWRPPSQPPPPSALDQYWTWVKGLWGGRSLHVISYTAPTRLNSQATTIWAALGHTAALLGGTVVLVVLLSGGLALATASRRGSALDLLLRGVAYLAWAVPAFLLALLVQLLVFRADGSRGIGPFPLAGWPGSCPTGLGINAGYLTPCPSAGSGLRYVVNVLRYLTLPVLTLAVGFAGLHGRYLHSTLAEALAAPFVTTARAKGLRERRVLVRHALRASLVSFLGPLLGDFGTLFAAGMAVDFVFQLNGLGTVFVSEFPPDFGSIDLYSLQPVLVLIGVLVIVFSLLADVAVFWLDPRARAER